MRKRRLNIVPFDPNSPEDYETIVAIRNEVAPEHSATVEEMKDSEKRRDLRCKRGRWIAKTQDNGITDSIGIGFASFGQSSWAYHPQRFSVNVVVRPGYEGIGIGGRLYQTVINALAPLDAAEMHVTIRENWSRGRRFAKDRGFREEMREWESRLDVAAFDASRWEAARQKPRRTGIEIRSYAELANDGERDTKLHALVSQTFRDVPSTVPLTPPPFERYREQVLENPNFLPEGVMIARESATGKFVGSSEVSKRQSDGDLETGLTGVLRDYRGRGIAMALKLRIIDYAKALAAPVIRTDNATTNVAMLSINDSLGFVRQPAWISYCKRIKEIPSENSSPAEDS